jgi:transcriptional regulator with XRE-family HTH domain
VENKDQPSIKVLFGKAVRRRRRELDFSQEEIAHRAGLHRTHVANIERGEHNPSLETIAQLAHALDISIAQLLTDYGVEKNEE